MIKRKNYLLISLLSLCVFAGIANAQLSNVNPWGEDAVFPYENPPVKIDGETHKIGEMVGIGMTDSDDTILNKLLDTFGF
jgi:hypothetical protein